MSERAPSPIILYVDDERPNRIVFEQSLGSEFAIKTAEDANTALTLLATHDVAVVITDMRMPTMSGEELLRIVKERSPQSIRIVVTAYADVDPILRAINEGLVARYILKPWVRTEMVQVLRWALEAWTFSRDSAALYRRLLETERLATLGYMVGMLVHDLRQPLMSLIGNVDYLREFSNSAPMLQSVVGHLGLPPPQQARMHEMLGDLPLLTSDLKTSLEHLNHLVDQIREFGRPTNGLALNRATDPLPIVRHAMAVCQELAVTVKASIGYEGPRALPFVRMSATELTQIMINLVANGTQAVAACGRAGTVSIVGRDHGSSIELVVRDDGVGMPPEVLDRVGTPFFTTRSEGTGLGLAQCQRLIGTAGGRLRIESEVGVGTTVTVTLPTAA